MRCTIMRAALVAVALLAAVVLPGAARAAPPANDNFSSARVIDPNGLPFSESVPIDEATLEPGEPSGCYLAGKSTWYSFTPTSSGVLRADIGGSTFFDRILYVYREDGSGLSGLSTVACASPYYNGLSAAKFGVEAGKTYYLQVGGFYASSTGTLKLSVQAIPPPPNDDFASAKPVASIPFSDSVDTSAASVESGEPTPSCGYGQSAGTVWYAFTPAASGSFSASVPYSGFWSQVAVYKGSGLGSLTQLGCRTFGSLLTFRADAGSTYYLQIGGLFGGRGTLSFTIDVAPNPIVGFGLSPGDPSIFDTVQFYDFSYDPGQVGIASRSWDFGDGSSSTDANPSHRYAEDGHYLVQLTVTTSDDRTASTSRLIDVRTHDVAIGKILVPQTASVGQTRSISVGVVNARYPETVQVQLFKSGPSLYDPFQLVGTLTQSVPVRGPNRTTEFSFNYTFTNEDAVAGKVTFKAVATIIGARDALPGDNTVISLATRVIA